MALVPANLWYGTPGRRPPPCPQAVGGHSRSTDSASLGEIRDEPDLKEHEVPSPLPISCASDLLSPSQAASTGETQEALRRESAQLSGHAPPVWPSNVAGDKGSSAVGAADMFWRVAVLLVVPITAWANGEAQQVRPARRELAVVQDPQARCDLCQDNWLLILGAGGRTGSTTALSMLSAIPGFEIAGEHWGLLHDEYNIMEHIKDVAGRDSVSWRHNPIDMHGLRCSVQERMKRLVLGSDFESKAASTKVIGFKEVRYHTLEMLHFIKEVFPCSQLLFTYRKKPQATVRAKFGFGSDYNNKWLSATPLFRRVHDLFNDTCSMFGVEALTTKHYNRVLHDKLGVRGCNYTHIIHDNADGGYSADENVGNLISGECDLSQVDFRLSSYELERRKALWQRLFSEHEMDKDEAHSLG